MLLRARTDEEARVASVELFFDLVFVLGVTQLSHRLLTHLDAHGALETGLLLTATLWVWVFTAWVTNWLDPDRTAVRLLLFVLMSLGLFLSMAIPTAYASRGLVFALSYVGLHIVRSGFMLFALRAAEPGRRRSFARITAWFALSGMFWIAGGLLAENARLALWVVAMLVELTGPAVGFRTPGYGRTTAAEWDIDGHHLAERCGLFIIIALGEAILVTAVWESAAFRNVNAKPDDDPHCQDDADTETAPPN